MDHLIRYGSSRSSHHQSDVPVDSSHQISDLGQSDVSLQHADHLHLHLHLHLRLILDALGIAAGTPPRALLVAGRGRRSRGGPSSRAPRNPASRGAPVYDSVQLGLT